MAYTCKECGCTCKKCISNDDVHLHVEIENLKQKLVERENHIVTMETNFLNEANKFPNGEIGALREELLTWQDKYKRLYDAHRRLQRVNQGLEDKLLKLVDVCETDKNTLTKDVATLSHKLAEANYAVKKLTDDNERYKSDVSLAIQFLQCKQSNFVAHKFDSLPQEVQTHVASHMSTKRKPEERRSPPEVKSIKVPIPTFPPTAMVYSVPKSPKPDRKSEPLEESSPVDIVSAAIMAKVLEERQKERAAAKHCDTCTCSNQLKIIYHSTHHSIGTQTVDYKDSCVRCTEAKLPDNVTGINVLRNVDVKMKKVPIYPNESIENAQTNNNIVKVQPNNFLTDNPLDPSSINASKNNLNTSSQDESFVNEERSNSSTKLASKYHRLCNKTSPMFERDTVSEKADSEKNVDKTSSKNASSENLKGPRYCSMRLQSGTRNILLDNAHNNIAPVLYTRTHHKSRNGNTPKFHDSSHTTPDSLSSSESRNPSLLSEGSIQNQQRVAEWIQNNLDGSNDVSSSENSRSDSIKNSNKSDVDKAKLSEMEENVKRFLFGESEFMKTVEIGRLKYQGFRENESTAGQASSSSRSVSCTKTDIL